MYEEEINVHTANTTLTFGVRCPPAANKKGDQLNSQTEKYLREKIIELHGSMPDFFPTLYDDLPTYEGDPVFVKERWKGTRTLTKNETFGSLYGAIAQTLFDVLRSKRDQTLRRIANLRTATVRLVDRDREIIVRLCERVTRAVASDDLPA